MAPLTWRNVEAPNFSGVADSYRIMGQALAGSTTGLEAALSGLQESQQKRDTGNFLAGISKYTDPAAYDAALKSGTAFAGVNPANISPDALKFASERQASLLANQGTGLANDQTAFNNQKAKDYEAARPAADAAMTEIKAAFSLGTPEGIARGRELMTKYTPAFSKAGFTPSQISALDADNFKSTDAGLKLNQAVVAAGDAKTEHDQNQAAKDIFSSISGIAVDPNDAALKIRAMNLRPEVMTKALALVENQGAAVFGPAADPNQVILEQRVPNKGAPTSIEGVANKIIGAESGGNANAQNPLSSAGGLGQFTDGTWLTTIKRYRPDIAAGRSDDQIIGLKKDGALNKEMTVALTGENADFLSSKGFSVTPGNIYLAHFAGQGGASALLKADPNARVDSVLDAGQVKANPFLKDWTVGQLSAWADKKMGGKVADARIGQAFGDPGAQSASDALSQAVAGLDTSALDNADTTNLSADQNQALLDQGLTLSAQAQSLQDTAKVDDAFNSNANLISELTTRPDHDASRIDVAKKIFDAIGKEGEGSWFSAFDSELNLPIITTEVNRVANKFGLAPDMAGAFVKNAIETNTNWFTKDTLDVNENKVDELVSQFIDTKTGGVSKDKLKGATEQLAAIRGKQVGAQRLAAANQQVEQAKQEYFNAVQRARTNPAVDIQTPKLRYTTLLAQLQKEIGVQDDNPFLRANTNPLTGK